MPFTLTEVFFQELGQRRYLFVLDNVDHYIDLEKLTFVSTLGALIGKALTRPHRSKFLLTCRPNVQADDLGILPIHLKAGLSLEETRELFRLRGVRLQTIDPRVEEIRNLVAGHPLWLNIIAVQLAGNRTTIEQMLTAIRRGQREVAENPADPIWATLRKNYKVILDPIWTTLKDKQVKVLRTMAEMVKPVTTKRLSEFLEPQMKYAQFSKNTRGLINLNLIVVKPRPADEDLIDLHPIVREYIKGKYLEQEQNPYISSIIAVLNRFIDQFKGHLDHDPTLDILEHWTQKVELNINRGNIEEAIDTLSDIQQHLISRGYSEEFIRVARKLFNTIKWEAAFQEDGKLDYTFDLYAHRLIQFGERTEVERLLSLYETAIPGKGPQYVRLCDLRCYMYWSAKSYEDAIKWGERGNALVEQTKADTRYTCDHNLALARRDSGQLPDALKYFLDSSSLEDVVGSAEADSSKHASFYGNIGRCLYLMNRGSDAINCYKKSARLLERSAPEPDLLLNRGFARLWIGEILEETSQPKEALIFYRAAHLVWEKVSPLRATEAQTNAKRVCAAHPEISGWVEGLQSEQIEEACHRWLAGKPISS